MLETKFTNNMYLDLKNIILRKIEFDQNENNKFVFLSGFRNFN